MSERTLVSKVSWDALPLSISNRPSVLGVIDSGLNVSTISSSSHGKFHSSSRRRYEENIIGREWDRLKRQVETDAYISIQ
jgi:hypothetical protein